MAHSSFDPFSSPSSLLPIGIIGLGRVGLTFAYRFQEAHLPVSHLFSRKPDTIRSLHPDLKPLIYDIDALPNQLEAFKCLIFCIPDDDIASVSSEIAAFQDDWNGYVIVHTSGLHTSASLGAFSERGAKVMSFHPLQTFSNTEKPAVLEHIYIALEGDEQALSLGKNWTRALNTKYLVLPPDAKARYHLAASVASNFLVTLVALVQEVLHSIGIEAQTAFELMQPLMAGTWKNLQQQMPEEALTGPIVRGDVQTIEAHLATLRARQPHLIPFYTTMAMETVRLAVRANRLSKEQAWALLDPLWESIEEDTI
jgi:predicted short-subunit dehydrogenase-like oxidoreductase (DUF2520 family)